MLPNIPPSIQTLKYFPVREKPYWCIIPPVSPSCPEIYWLSVFCLLPVWTFSTFRAKIRAYFLMYLTYGGTPMEPTKKNTTPNIGFFSLVAAILSFFVCGSPLLQFPIAMAGLTIALIERNRSGNHLTGVAMAGLILSIISIVISLCSYLIIICVYRVILPDPEFGPMYIKMYHQMMDLIQSGVIPSL